MNKRAIFFIVGIACLVVSFVSVLALMKPVSGSTPLPTDEQSTPVFKPTTPEPTIDTSTPTPTNTPKPSPQNSIDPTKPIIALTFDDGPAPSTTRILDILEGYGVRATFFIVGDMACRNSAIVERAYAMGCEIGNHTQTHKVALKGISATEVRKEITPVDEFMLSLIGERPKYIRPPWGSFDETALDAFERPVILWSVDTRDWDTRDSQKIVQHIKDNVFDGAILLMHDLYPETANAVGEIVPWLIEQGYQLVTIGELFEARGIELLPGHAYRSAVSEG
ncbi:MAG: polysaccharide deacetylase family protein [Clostridiales bacterium]|nr:polysaccharide deacetylase family protein [Clostridiales bacterium]